MLTILTPHLRIESVLELSVERLHELGLDALLLDVDCTLKRYGAGDCDVEVTSWIEELRVTEIRLCLISNGYARRIGPFAERLGLPFVAKAMKPLPGRIRAAVRRMGLDRRRTAMVGDQLFADVLAARLAGLFSILVTPIHPEEEHWFTRIKRPPERLLLARLDPKDGGVLK